jgi:hypothetical protein
MILADANLAIDYPMPSVVNGNLGIEPLDIDRQELPGYANNACRCLPMVTDVYPMVAEESSVANPQNIGKIDEKIRKMEQKLFGNTALDLKQLMTYPIPWLTLIIDSIGYHRLASSKHCWHRWGT